MPTLADLRSLLNDLHSAWEALPDEWFAVIDTLMRLPDGYELTLGQTHRLKALRRELWGEYVEVDKQEQEAE